ncbi:8122_t:CDS:2 [Ambispora leptoticha]|uniref:8122_t:CDS:1 n=1 Tax=Ambispora leptoticha TaxID=144679 RepID=A0A9N9BC92_9GLOM|nr:8122_t:CDS:2 [Ambispora leptoticha]
MEINFRFISLPPEIRQEIFKNLNQGSLYNCLRTNRQLCREIVPILWAEPFRITPKITRRIYFNSTVNYEQSQKIISIYLGCFTRETWSLLRANGISRPRTTRSPIFDYATFITHLDPISICNAAGAWLKQKKYPTVKQCNKRKVLTRALCQLFLDKSRSLRSFCHNLYLDIEFWCPNPLEFPNTLAFKSLKDIHIFGIHKHKDLLGFFLKLAGICHSLRGIALESDWFFENPNANSIEATNTAEGLKYFLMMQKDLQWLKIINLPYVTIKAINKSLSLKSIRSIKFESIDFSVFKNENLITSLTSCENLQCLDLHSCRGLEQKTCIETAEHFTRLEYFAFFFKSSYYEPIPSEFIKQVVEASSNSLRYLRLENAIPGIIDSCKKREIIDTVLSNSYNLKSISIFELDIEEAIPLLERFENLVHLDIFAELSEVFDKLKEKLPLTLYSLRIHGFSKAYSTESFAQFLMACKHLKYLSIYPFNDDCKRLASSYGVKLSSFSYNEKIYPDYFHKF